MPSSLSCRPMSITLISLIFFFFFFALVVTPRPIITTTTTTNFNNLFHKRLSLLTDSPNEIDNLPFSNNNDISKPPPPPPSLILSSSSSPSFSSEFSDYSPFNIITIPSPSTTTSCPPSSDSDPSSSSQPECCLLDPSTFAQNPECQPSSQWQIENDNNDFSIEDLLAPLQGDASDYLMNLLKSPPPADGDGDGDAEFKGMLFPGAEPEDIIFGGGGGS